MKQLLAGTYFFIGFIYGMFLYGESKVECIEKVGVLRGVFIGCDEVREMLIYRGEPSLIKSQLKGLVWPYFMFFNNKEVDTTQSQSKLYKDLAKMLVDSENSRAPKRIDKYTIFKKASLKDQTIYFNYELEKSSITLMRLLNEETTFVDTQRSLFCREGEDKASKVINALLGAGFKFHFIYDSVPKQSAPISFEINNCSKK